MKNVGRALKIGFISYEFPPDRGKGGIATYTEQIAFLLVNSGFEIHVFASSPRKNKNEIINGVSVHWIKSVNPSDFQIKVAYEFKKSHQLVKFDFIESAEIHGNALKIKKDFPDIPLIVRLHAPNYVVEHFKLKYVSFYTKIRFVLGALRRGKVDLGFWSRYKKNEDLDFQFTIKSDYITAPSEWMRNWTTVNWKIKKEDIFVYPNPFIPEKDLLSLPLLENHPFKTIIFYGRLNILKGLYNLTKAMKIVLKQHSEWKLVIIGDDGPGPNPHKKSMKNWMIDEFGILLNQVIFIDGIEQNQLSKFLACCEIMLIPSLFESFSYVCKEGMAAGKAVVGSLNGGMVDLIDNYSTGILINPYNHKEIIKEIDFLIKNPKECSKISLNARLKILKDNSNDEILNFYRNLNPRLNVEE